MRREALAAAGPFAVAWFLLTGFRATVPVMLPELRRLYGVEYGDAGLIFGVLFVGIALLQLPSGLLGDALGDRGVVVASLLGTSVVLGLFGLATSVPALLVLAFAFGATLGSFRSVAISAVTKRATEERRNAAVGIMAAANPLGNLVGPASAGVVLAAVGVAWTPPAFAALGLVVSAAVALWLGVGRRRAGGAPDSGDEGDPPADGDRGVSLPSAEEVGRHGRVLLDAVRSPEGLLIVAISAAFSVVFQGTFSFLPSYLVDVRGLAIEGTGLVTGVTFGVGVVASLASGRAADRVGEGIALSVGFALGAASLVALRSVESLLPAVLALVGLGLGLGAITPPRDAFIASLSPPENRGSVVGGVRTTYILLASTATVGTGYLIQAAGFGPALAFFAAVLGAGALASLALVWVQSGGAAGDGATS